MQFLVNDNTNQNDDDRKDNNSVILFKDKVIEPKRPYWVLESLFRWLITATL